MTLKWVAGRVKIGTWAACDSFPGLSELPQGFGLRREVERHAAFRCDTGRPNIPDQPKAPLPLTLQASLRYALAGCRRSPKWQREFLGPMRDRMIVEACHENPYNRMKKTVLKFIYDLIVIAGFLCAVVTLFMLFCIVLPYMRDFVVHKNDRFVLETIYIWARRAVIVAVATGAILAFSTVALWIEAKRLYRMRRQKLTGPSNS